jgi:hypothetical protein
MRIAGHLLGGHVTRSSSPGHSCMLAVVTSGMIDVSTMRTLSGAVVVAVEE